MQARFPIVLVALSAILAACNSDTVAAPPASADWTVNAGASRSSEALQALRFYPQSISIDAGDTVQWNFPAGEPHTVTLLGPRATPAAPSDPNDSVPAGPSSYDGTTYVNSGFKLLGASFRLKFAKPGTYTFVCLIHPGMTGTINVAAQGSPYTSSQAAYAAAANTQAANDLSTVTASVNKFPFATGGPHLAAGMSPDMAMGQPSPLTILRFLDGPSLTDTSVTIAAGQVVTWTNESGNEPHTVTIAPAGATFPSLPPFSPPSGGNVYDGTTLVNSGVLNPGQNFSLQFTKPGVYTYHCIFHDDIEGMIGTVIVQ